MTDDRHKLTGLSSPLRHLDAQAVSVAASRESRAREKQAPPISTYRWWARRTMAVVGGVLDAVAQDRPGQLLVCDPFAGGGTVGLAAALRGHRAYLQDVNPWAVRGLATMFTLPPAEELRAAKAALEGELDPLLARAYGTKFMDGEPAAIAHTLRVAQGYCPGCSALITLFPYSLVSLLKRAEQGRSEAWMACRDGHVFLGDGARQQRCPECHRTVRPKALYTAGRMARCESCLRRWPVRRLTESGPLQWRPVLVERSDGTRRELAPPTDAEHRQADEGWRPRRTLGAVRDGAETRQLIRHGFTEWELCYPARQRVVLEAALDSCARLPLEDTVRRALETALIGTAEMAGYLSRWDRRYLKAYEAMAAHRFNLTTLACEPNVWGTGVGRGTAQRRIEALARAATWMRDRVGSVPVHGPLPSSHRRSPVPASAKVRLVLGSSERLTLPVRSVDLVWTDPPYHDDVHYGQLSTPFRVWTQDTTPLAGEAVATSLKDATYESLLRAVFAECRRVLKEDGHLILTYANREPSAWAALFAALVGNGFRACGWDVVVSDNDSYHAKRGRGSCTMDLILDLVPAERTDVEQWSPHRVATGIQESFLMLVGAEFLRIVQPSGPPSWRHALIDRLATSPFLDHNSLE